MKAASLVKAQSIAFIYKCFPFISLKQYTLHFYKAILNVFITVITVLEVKNCAIDINSINKKYAKEALHVTTHFIWDMASVCLPNHLIFCA